jgi:two-component system phosphate regulon response regulator PhoB
MGVMAEPGGARPSVLVVEDDASMRALLRLFFTLEGWEVLEAGDGIVACELLRQALPQVVVSDVHMPRMGGLELLAALKSDPMTCDLPVVLITGDEQAPAAAAGYGAAACLTKPLRARELLDTAGALASASRRCAPTSCAGRRTCATPAASRRR